MGTRPGSLCYITVQNHCTDEQTVKEFVALSLNKLTQWFTKKSKAFPHHTVWHIHRAVPISVSITLAHKSAESSQSYSRGVSLLVALHVYYSFNVKLLKADSRYHFYKSLVWPGWDLNPPTPSARPHNRFFGLQNNYIFNLHTLKTVQTYWLSKSVLSLETKYAS